MDKLILSLKENCIDIAVVSKLFNKIKVMKLINFFPGKVNQLNVDLYNSEDNISKMKTLLLENKIRRGKAYVILSFESIITRLIEVPCMSKKDLNSFIQNNIEEYFTVNINEFYFDYEVVGIDKSNSKKLTVLLAAVPKTKLNDIIEFLKSCEIKPVSISIYPECISRLFTKEKSKSIAVFDLNEDHGYVTLLDRGAVFLHSGIAYDFIEDEENHEIIDNLGYFLNFYSSRHFGAKVDEIFLFGSLAGNQKLQKLLRDQFGIIVNTGIRNLYTRINTSKDINPDICADVIGDTFTISKTYNKIIDFKNTLQKKAVDKFYILIGKLSAVLIFTTILWTASSYAYINSGLKKSDTSVIESQIEGLKGIEKNTKELNARMDELKKRQSELQSIKNDEFDYIKILDVLKNGLPPQIGVKSLVLDKESLKITLSINNSTLDVARAVIAINSMGIFKRVEISDVRLDDSVNEASFELKFNENNTAP